MSNIAIYGGFGQLNWPIFCVNVSRGSGQATTQMYTVTLYDIKNKFVAFSAAVPEVVDVICEWGSPYVLLVDGKVCRD